MRFTPLLLSALLAGATWAETHSLASPDGRLAVEFSLSADAPLCSLSAKPAGGALRPDCVRHPLQTTGA